MDWIRENKSLAAIVFAGLAGVLGLGFLLYQGYDSYASSKDVFATTSGSLARMKSAPLAPTPENLKAKQDAVKEYEQVVNKLGTVLLALQQKDQPISDTEFQAKLKSLIAETKKKAARSRVGLPGDFAFGFEEYTGSLPSNDEAASQLATYLDSVHAVVDLMLDSGVRRITTLARTPLDIEKGAQKEEPKTRGRPAGRPPTAPGAPAPVAAKATERRTIEVTMDLDQVPLQLLMNQLSSPSGIPFFTVVRNLRVENTVQTGPMRSEVFIPSGGNDGSGQAGPGDDEEGGGDGTIKAAEAAAPDAVAVMGNEILRVYMEIDLVRFLPEEQAAAATAPRGN